MNEINDFMFIVTNEYHWLIIKHLYAPLLNLILALFIFYETIKFIT